MLGFRAASSSPFPPSPSLLSPPSAPAYTPIYHNNFITQQAFSRFQLSTAITHGFLFPCNCDSGGGVRGRVACSGRRDGAAEATGNRRQVARQKALRCTRHRSRRPFRKTSPRRRRARGWKGRDLFQSRPCFHESKDRGGRGVLRGTGRCWWRWTRNVKDGERDGKEEDQE